MKPRLIGIVLVVVAALGVRARAPEAQARCAAAPPIEARRDRDGREFLQRPRLKDTSARSKHPRRRQGFPGGRIVADPNFIASDEFLTYDVAILFRNQNLLPQEEKVEAKSPRFSDSPKACHGALGHGVSFGPNTSTPSGA